MKNFEDTGIKKLISLIKAKFESLAKVATSGSYNDLSNKPTIPSVGNGKITVKQGGTTKGTFTVNQTGATTIELTDNDTHYASGTVVTNDATKTGNYGAALTNGNVHLNHVENGVVKNSHKLTGSGATRVTSDASGNIIITSTDNNTTYGAATTSANGLMTKEDKAKLDNLQVGGRNLLANTDVIYTRTKNDTYFGSYIFRVVSDINLNDLIGKKTVYSFWLNSPGERTQHETSSNAIKNRFGSHGLIIWQDSTGANPNRIVYPFTRNLTLTEEKTRVYATYTITPPVGYDTIIDMRVLFQLYARPSDTNDATWEIGQPKLEIGTIPTDWTPAPEDADSLYSSIDHTHTKSQITDFPTSLKNPNGLRVQVNGDGASEVRYDGSEAKTINLVAGDNVTLTQKTSENKVTIAAKDTTYSAGTGLSLSGTTFKHSNSVTAGTAQGDASKTLTFGGTFTVPTVTYDAQGHVTGKGTTTMTMPANPNTDTKVTQTLTSSNASYPLLLAPSGQTVTTTTTARFASGVTLNPSTNTIAANISGSAAKVAKALTVKANGTQLYTYDGSEAKTVNIKAGSNITITSDSSGNITISSTASAGSVTGDVGEVVYEATSGGLYCDGKTYATKDNSYKIQDPNPNGYYKRFRFYCQGYYGLVCVDMPLDREHPAYITTNGTRYGGVIFPTAENGNINNNTGIGPSNHMYYELKWRVTRDLPVWKVQVIDSGWLGLNAGKTTNADYAGNASTSDAGTGQIEL